MIFDAGNPSILAVGVRTRPRVVSNGFGTPGRGTDICATPGVYRPSAQAEAHVAGSATHLLEIGVRLPLLESKCVCIVAVLANRLQPLWGYGAGPAIR